MECIYLSSCKASKQLLGKSVGHGLALLALVVLKRLETSKGSSSSNHLMAQARLVLLKVVVVVDLVVVVFLLV